MAFGITATGFNKKRLADSKTEIEDSFKAAFGQNVNLRSETVFGQMIGIMAERESKVWDMAEDVYNSQYPNNSEDTNLDNVSSITGSIRKGATKSAVIGQLMLGTPGTIIPINSIMSVVGNSLARFLTDSAVTLVAGTDEIQDLTFGNSPDGGSFKLKFGGLETALILFSDTAGGVQAKLEAISSIGVGNISVAGVIDSATGLTFTLIGLLAKEDVALLEVTTNTLNLAAVATTTSMVETTPGVPQGSVNLTAESTGPTDAPSKTLTTIETPVAGWDSTKNPLDAVLGAAKESNADFRLRRDDEVSIPGSTTIDAIFAAVSAIANVTAVVVFQNITDLTDSDGRPPHSVDIVVEGGDEDVIAQTIFDDGVAGGIETLGDITKILKDSQNFDQIIKFSRPTPVDIHVEIDLIVDTALFPLDGDDQVEALILIYGQALSVGQDIIVFGSDPSLSCAFQSVPGILGITFRVGKTVSPTLDDNITIAPREIAAFDSSRITVVVP